ncbi:MAG: carboxypeptidase regulatory-like domain-containing protein, partial [Candidatus Aenigmatarchaeota archaeon]
NNTIEAGTYNDTSYWLYYNNSAATSPNENIHTVFGKNADNFDNDINASVWTAGAGWSWNAGGYARGVWNVGGDMVTTDSLGNMTSLVFRWRGPTQGPSTLGPRYRLFGASGSCSEARYDFDNDRMCIDLTGLPAQCASATLNENVWYYARMNRGTLNINNQMWLSNSLVVDNTTGACRMDSGGLGFNTNEDTDHELEIDYAYFYTYFYPEPNITLGSVNNFIPPITYSNLTINVFDEENPDTSIERFVAQFIAGSIVNTFGINKTFIDETANTDYGNLSYDNDFDTNSTTSVGHAGVGYQESVEYINGTVLVGDSESACVRYRYLKQGSTGAGGAVNTSISILVDGDAVGEDSYFQSSSAATQDSGTVVSCFNMTPDSITEDVVVRINFSSYAPGAGKTLDLNLYVNELFIEEQINDTTLVVSQIDLIDGTNAIFIDDAEGQYRQREYVVEVNASDRNQNLIAYLMRTTEDPATVLFTVTNTFGNPLPGVNVNVEKIIGSAYTTVTEGLTDDIGSFQIILVNNDPYRATMTLAGFNTRVVNFRAQTREISVIMNQTVTLDLVTPFQDIWLLINPQTISYNSSQSYHNITFNYTINSSSDLLIEYGFALYCNNTLVNSTVDTSSTGGSVSVLYNVIGCSNVSMTYNFTKNDSTFYENTIIWYPIIQQMFGLNEALARMAQEYDTSTLNFLIVIIFIVVAGALTVISPEIAGLAWLPIGGMFVYYGMLSFTFYALIAMTLFSVLLIKRRWL